MSPCTREHSSASETQPMSTANHSSSSTAQVEHSSQHCCSGCGTYGSSRQPSWLIPWYIDRYHEVCNAINHLETTEEQHAAARLSNQHAAPESHTIHDGVHQPPLGRFSMLDIPTVGVVSAEPAPKKVGVGTISPRASPRRIVRY